MSPTSQKSTEAQQALGRIGENPFFVSTEDLKLGAPDIVFRLNRHENALRAAPRYRSKAKKLLEKTPGVHYLKSEKSYYFPTPALNDFLKVARDKKISFAVEMQAGERLKRGSKLRARSLDKPTAASAAELEESLLTPYLQKLAGEIPRFSLHGPTAAQLRDCFPNTASFGERTRIAKGMNEELLLKLVYHSAQSNTRVWQSREVAEHLDKLQKKLSLSIETNREAFNDAALGIAPPEACWTLDKNARGGLLLTDDQFSSLFGKRKKALGEFPKIPHPQHEGFFFVGAGDSKLLTFIKAVEDKGELFPKSESFAARVELLCEREEIIKGRAKFLSMKDAALTLSDSEFEQRLFPHQRVAVAWLRENPAAFLGDDMGLGKTLSVLTHFDALKEQGEVDFLLVACPNSLTRNWARETKQWRPKRTLELLPDTKKEKIQYLKNLLSFRAENVDGLAINYEGVRLDYVFPLLEALCKEHRVMLCLDESQRVKNPRSKTFAALKDIAALCKHRILLSGTPTPKDVSDIWAQMYLLDQGERFGTNYYHWLTQVAELGNKWSEFAIKRFYPEEVEEVIARVHEVLLRRRKEDVVNLPEKIFARRDVTLSGDQKKRYEEIRKELLLRVRTASGKTFVREIDNILEEYLRAVQAASNPRLIDDQWKGEPAKFIELDEIVHEVVAESGRKLVVWTNYRGNVEELTLRYKRHGAAAFYGDISTEDRDKTLKAFQDPQSDCKILIAIPAAGGVGITLTAAQTAVYLDKTWNGEHWMQSIDRVHRIGQTGTVNVISLHASRVDDLISRNLEKKQKAQAKLLGDGVVIEAELAPTREELIEALKK